MVLPSSGSKNMRSMKSGWCSQEAGLWLLLISSKHRLTFLRNTQSYIPEDRTLRNNWSENLRFNKSTLKVWWDIHCDECPQCGLPDSDTVLSCRYIPSFRGMCSLLSSASRLTLKMEVACSFAASLACYNGVITVKTTIGSVLHVAPQCSPSSCEVLYTPALGILQLLKPVNESISLYNITASFINRFYCVWATNNETIIYRVD
jgi:hypothetical protein